MGDVALVKSDLPTRLIDVGYPDDESVRLRETQVGDSIRYNDLPATFRDAVVPIRALGL